jgi:dihydroflavonol-4-reductase
MIVLVTGASGHVGANLVHALLAKGYKVRTLVHENTAALEGLDIETVRGDVCDLTSLCQACAGIQVVYHLAARISLSTDDRDELERINVTGTRNVVEACITCGIKRLVHFSSIHAMVQTPLNVPVDENRPLVGAKNSPPYDRSKADGEREVLKGIQRGLNAVIISPTAVIGPRDFQPSHFGAVLLLLAEQKLPALVSGGFDWVDVRDVAAGAISAAERALPGSKYLLSGHWVSMKDVAGTVHKLTGAPVPGFVCPNWLARASLPIINRYYCQDGERPLYTNFSLKTLCSNRNISCARASRDLDYHPRPFAETLRNTLHWFKENGYLKVKTNLA